MAKEMILAIESSCDESSVAILIDGELKECLIDSQIETFIDYGGVVPEIAARLHEQNLPILIDRILRDYNFEDITHIAYTAEPGLNGPLLVGKTTAETLALYGNKKLVPINHMYGHIVSPLLTDKITYPALGLIVSGGHTQLIHCDSETKYKVLSNTLDDAIGECFDKVARMLNLPYPGGPEIDKLAKLGKPVYDLPIPMEDDSLDFSFSGLKSATLNLLNKFKMKDEKFNPADVACSFQTAGVKTLLSKAKMAWNNNYKAIFIAGGVSANSQLRDTFKDEFDNVVLTKLKYTGDNAAMIGLAAHYKINDK